jgi:hypothetical protein
MILFRISSIDFAVTREDLADPFAILSLDFQSHSSIVTSTCYNNSSDFFDWRLERSLSKTTTLIMFS